MAVNNRSEAHNHLGYEERWLRSDLSQAAMGLGGVSLNARINTAIAHVSGLCVWSR